MALATSRQKLLNAIEQCQLNKIISLVKQGHNIHMRNKLGQNFLVHLLQQSHEDLLLSKKRFQIFRFLITNYNLNIHAFDYYGKNLFNWATNLNRTQAALYLLDTYPGDIDILVRDRTGSCSLHYAVEHGNDILVQAIVNYLLRYRLRFDIKDAHNNTPEDLARKLGYEKISQFLAEACRSTVFLSREIPFQQKQTRIDKPKSNNTLTSSSSTSLLDSSEYFNLIETRINAAKSSDDWKTVTTLRAFKKYSNKIPDPIPKIIPRTTHLRSFPKLPSIHIPSPPEQMLRLIEPQLCPSFRRPFTPIYQKPITPKGAFRRSSNILRRLSPTSPHRMSSGLSQRQRDSINSQSSISILPDLQNRISIAPGYKQYRQSFVATN